MRVLITARPKFPLPPEQIPGLMQGFTAWREQYRNKMEAFFFFAAPSGGGGILNVADENELARIMLEWPLSLYSDVTADPIVDGDFALGLWQELLQRIAS